MPNIQNESQLLKAMEEAAQKTLTGISSEVLKIFQEEYLKKIAYTKNPTIYQRTNQFFEAWDFTEVKKALNILSTELWYNSDKLRDFDPETFVHGSKYSSPPDVRDNLQDILNKAGYSSSLWLSVKRAVPYWDTFIIDMFNGGQLEKIISKHFNANGFRK